MGLNNPAGSVTINTGDIEIGAVEVKDATTDTRAVVDASFGLAVDVKRSVAIDTELPAAALLANAATIPTAPIVGAALMGSNATTLDLLRTALANGGSNNGVGDLAVSNHLYSSSGVYYPEPVAKGVSDGSDGVNVPVTALMGWLGATLQRLQVDSVKNLKVTTEYTLLNLVANATSNAIKTGAGVLHAITINTKGITNTATVYDALTATGTKIATIDTTLGQATLIFDGIFATGLTIVIAGGTPADITVTYR